MAEPSTLLVGTGSGLVLVATVALGPILGEYAIIAGMGLLGTLVALSEMPLGSFWRSVVFVFKGVMFSFAFTGIITVFVLKSLPADMGFTPYALMGMVAFTIGWMSNKAEKIKNSIAKRLGLG